MARLYEKLGVTNRAQALMEAVQLGLIRYEIDVRADRAGSVDGERRTASRVTAPA